ncbi:MAG: enoyl-CoA hydratase/isomerase family protein [Deltaproteobacteria bacterium]|nr:enoyl-CoA hydratase/isomerase family protein [Deltaproteobacteria bacterium]MBW1923782.1 enoyl-CoA hydratase/isomerase family protein [Deltaproteobacteria bacterium]MBW1949039.1 enoyl-CoA hydratase/isomerase family protein [Deltaproteobacteria bacterium]MBW2008569.1 enoyl-CoA hydratase/isomerase family protein [Deltaproteobacteria bacterium]MBW2346969.1 enoyl-CoA hydratase/isomerase family protein [Deltaproteobacteria bacterium]
MKYETILFEKEGEIAAVTLNRPNRLNALSFRLKDELGAIFDEIERDEDIKVVILTGGKKAFSAGADIKERSTMETTQPQAYFNQLKSHAFYTKIENFEKPVIAAISGVAVGGGCELAMVCDLRIASETARFGLPEVNIGVIPAAGGTQRLPRLIGVTRAKELLYTGDFIDAQEAFRIGLVNRVVPVENLMDETKALAQKLAAKPPLSIKYLKRAINIGTQLDLSSALDYEAHIAAMLTCSEDRKEGFVAFVEKRKPVFKGR